MTTSSTTATRILKAFLKLAAERGIEATSMRALATEAKVNEVTIFRIFTSKVNLIRETYQYFAPGNRIQAYTLALDTSNPASAEAGLLACLRFLRDCWRDCPQLLFVSMSEYWNFPTLHAEMAFHPQATHRLIQQALAQAQPVLRPDLDLDAAALTLLGLLLTTISWQYYGWLTLTDAEWEHKIMMATHLLVQNTEK